MNYILTIVFAFCSILALHGQGKSVPYISAELASRHLLAGEQTLLTVHVHHARPNSRPGAPDIPDTAVNFVSTVTRIDQQRRLTQSYVYRLRPAKPGIYTVPPIGTGDGDNRNASQPLSFEVHDSGKLSRVITDIPGKDVLVGWFPEKTTLYQGEQCPVTLKVYVPERLNIIDPGLPEPEKNNCLAWRFTKPSRNSFGRTTIDNIPCISMSYKTTLSGISPGAATLGPVSLRMVTRRRVINPRFGSLISDVPLKLNLPKLEFQILKLPQGAPADFAGAIGEFHVATQYRNKNLEVSDTAEVILSVGGKGNLENIQAPQLTGKGWKIIDTSKVTRGQERRFISGTVTFRQLLRPDPSGPLPTFIPPYSFSFFNPGNKSYQSLTTPAIPVKVAGIPAIGAGTSAEFESVQEALGLPPGEMSDILGFIDSPANDKTSGLHSMLISWAPYWQLIPAIVCLTIIALPLWRKIKAARSRHPDELRKQNALKKIHKTSDCRTFYRRSGRFIEQWLDPNEELNAVLAERDQLCFLPGENTPHKISELRKKEIISLLNRYAKLSLFLLLAVMTNPSAQAADKNPNSSILNAMKNGHYRQAIELYQEQYRQPAKTPADILYNIGNCHYRLKQPGHAALAWRRALARKPDHPHARQNLRYLELEEGSITPELHPWQHFLTSLPLSLYRNTLWISLWLLLITILILTLLRPGRSTGLLMIAFLMPIAAALGALGVYFYPDTDIRASFSQQAVCLDKTDLHVDAHRQSSTGILPPASLLRIKATRGTWIHVESPDGQSGWIAENSVSTVLPDKL